MIFYSQKLKNRLPSSSNIVLPDGVEFRTSREPQQNPAPETTIVQFGIPFNQPDPRVAGLVKNFALFLDGVTTVAKVR
jgi:hypothetical protein